MHTLRAATRLALFVCLVPATVVAQTRDTTHTVHLPVGDSALRIPADRASDLVAWAPGGGLDEASAPTWHGLSIAQGTWVIDGVRWVAGLRSTGFNGVGPRGIQLEPGLNTLSDATLSNSALGPVTFDLTTRSAGDRWSAHGSTETGAPFRPDGGTGDSRLQVAAGGPIGGGFRLQLGGDLAARQAASGGVGYAKAPYYLATGVDTTMEFYNGTDSITAPIQHYTPSAKVPYTPRSTADWTLRLDGKVGTAAAWAHWVGTRASEGLFNYLDAFNPPQINGLNEGAYDVAAGIDVPALGRHLTAAIALQHERSEQGPLTYASQLDTRNAGLGLMLGGVDLRWDMDNFPLDDQLLTNYQKNTTGSRRTPYDLENTAQYSLIDDYRNSPYAMYGWSEGGGPLGTLRFYDDRRVVGSVGLVQEKVLGGSTTFGVEVVRHDARLYTSPLASQAFSNVWIEHPDEEAATFGWVYRTPEWTVDAGIRVDRFNSGARRTYDRVSDPVEPDYGKYVWFPRGFSIAATADSDVHWVADKAHIAAAPHLRAIATLGTEWDARIGLQRSASVPDFADLYDGINTDLAITNLEAPYGTDVGHEIVDHVEAGLGHHQGAFRADGVYFEDHYKKVVSTRLAPFYDPLKKQVNDLLYHPLIEGPTIKGVTLSATSVVTDHFSLGGAYTYQTTKGINYYYGPIPPVEESPIRHHSLAATARLTAPDHGITRGVAAIVTMRLLSGLAQATDQNGVPYSGAQPIRSTDVPAWKSLDLRLAKGTTIGGHRADVYLDARNLLNTANLLYVFPTGDPHGSPTAGELNWRADSASWATEGSRNGVYTAGTIDLTFSGAGRGGCGSWLASNGDLNPPNCAYLIAAEERFGNGDGHFTPAEQRSASDSYYLTQVGQGAFSGAPRAIRVGVEVGF